MDIVISKNKAIGANYLIVDDIYVKEITEQYNHKECNNFKTYLHTSFFNNDVVQIGLFLAIFVFISSFILSDHCGTCV